MQLITKQHNGSSRDSTSNNNSNSSMNKNKLYGNNSSSLYSDRGNNYYTNNDRESKYVKYDECNGDTTSGKTSISTDEARLIVGAHVKGNDNNTTESNKTVDGSDSNNNSTLFSKELE